MQFPLPRGSGAVSARVTLEKGEELQRLLRVGAFPRPLPVKAEIWSRPLLGCTRTFISQQLLADGS